MKLIILLLTLVSISEIAYGQEDTFNINQRASYMCTRPLILDSTKTSLTSRKVFFLFDLENSSTNLSSQGIRRVDCPAAYFMAYLVNTSDSTFIAERQDRSLIMIQEALDEKRNWEPIEYWSPSSCGLSYQNPLLLESGKYVMVPIKKYSGSFRTRIRLKFKYGDEVLYSDSFEGSVNKAQFKKITDEFNLPVSYLNKK